MIYSLLNILRNLPDRVHTDQGNILWIQPRRNVCVMPGIPFAVICGIPQMHTEQHRTYNDEHKKKTRHVRTIVSAWRPTINLIINVNEDEMRACAAVHTRLWMAARAADSSKLTNNN